MGIVICYNRHWWLFDIASHVDSSPRQLCYPWGNFSATTHANKKQLDGSLGPSFLTANIIGVFTVKPTYALALYGEFLTLLSRPLGASVSLSEACRPSQTVHHQVSPSQQVSLFNNRGQCSTGDSTPPGNGVSKSPDYALYDCRIDNWKLQ